MKFSANLGFLWTNRPLVEAIHAAKDAGFDAVECHWPYDTPPAAINQALQETGLAMLGLNTRRGDVSRGDNGLCALPDRIPEARAAIDEALDYAEATQTEAVHLMAGRAEGPEARQTFTANLAYALERAQGRLLLIEPLNPYNAPGYFLNSTALAAEILAELGAPNLRLMFDCYHVQILEGDVTRRLTKLAPLLGHIQIAGVPQRDAPNRGELNYRHILEHIQALGWQRPIGAEYLSPVPDLAWLAEFRSI